MRPALSDYSTMPDLPTWVLVIGVIAAVLVVAYLFCGPLVHRAPLHDEDVSGLDALDGLHEGEPACHSAGPRGGHYVRAAGDWWVCEACGDTWLRVNNQPYDQEAAS